MTAKSLCRVLLLLMILQWTDASKLAVRRDGFSHQKVVIKCVYEADANQFMDNLYWTELVWRDTFAHQDVPTIWQLELQPPQVLYRHVGKYTCVHN